MEKSCLLWVSLKELLVVLYMYKDSFFLISLLCKIRHIRRALDCINMTIVNCDSEDIDAITSTLSLLREILPADNETECVAELDEAICRFGQINAGEVCDLAAASLCLSTYDTSFAPMFTPEDLCL